MRRRNVAAESEPSRLVTVGVWMAADKRATAGSWSTPNGRGGGTFANCREPSVSVFQASTPINATSTRAAIRTAKDNHRFHRSDGVAASAC